MNVQEYCAEISSRLALKTAVIYAFGFSLLTNVLLAGGMVFADRRDRVVVLPAEITKSFWLDQKDVSPDYLEQMSVFALQLALNNSPETFDFNQRKLLSYVAPEARGQTELALIAQGRQFKNANASIHFLAESVEVKPALLQAAVTGTVRQFIGNTQTSVSKKCWLVEFSYQGSRLWIQAIRESSCKKPFEALKTEEIA